MSAPATTTLDHPVVSADDHMDLNVMPPDLFVRARGVGDARAGAGCSRRRRWPDVVSRRSAARAQRTARQGVSRDRRARLPAGPAARATRGHGRRPCAHSCHLRSARRPARRPTTKLGWRASGRTTSGRSNSARPTPIVSSCSRIFPSVAPAVAAAELRDRRRARSPRRHHRSVHRRAATVLPRMGPFLGDRRRGSHSDQRAHRRWHAQRVLRARSVAGAGDGDGDPDAARRDPRRVDLLGHAWTGTPMSRSSSANPVSVGCPTYSIAWTSSIGGFAMSSAPTRCR